MYTVAKSEETRKYHVRQNDQGVFTKVRGTRTKILALLEVQFVEIP